jgi:hypothetical protein
VAAVVLHAQDRCDDCLIARYWRVPANAAFKFPENPEDRPRPDFGIAISGGGVRSAAAAVGQLRGLQYNKWLEKVGYVSAVSGGAWAAVPFTYSKSSIDELVGTMANQRPCDLTPDGLKTAVGSIGQAVADTNLAPGGIREGIGFALQQNDDWIKQQAQTRFKFIGDHYDTVRDFVAGKLFPKGTRQNKTYGRLLGKFFLDPLIEPLWTLAHDKQAGPLASARTFGWTATSIASMSSAAQPHGFPSDMLTVRDRPYLIVGATMVVPGTESDDDYPTLVPFEFTPLYSGSRVGPDGKGPGLYVSSWAIDTDEVGPSDQPNSFRAHLDLSDPLTLADVIAATGAAPELTLLTTDKAPGKLKDIVRKGAKFFPEFSTVGFDDDGAMQVNAALSFGDGGFRDNLGIMPLLARGVHNVLVFFNTNTPLSQMNDDVKSLFMRVDLPGGSGNKTGNIVFDAVEYEPLYDTLLEAEHGHAPQIYCKKGLDVRANALYGIRPYSGLNLCIFYAADVQQWHDELSPQVKSFFGSDIKKHRLDQFPLYPTYELNLQTEQVNLLGNLWSWVVTRKETVTAVSSTLTGLPPPPALQACPR